MLAPNVRREAFASPCIKYTCDVQIKQIGNLVSKTSQTWCFIKKKTLENDNGMQLYFD